MKKYLTIICLFFFIKPAFSQDLRLTGTVINSKESTITFMRHDASIITGIRSDKRYKAKLNDQGKFDIVLPVETISKWLVEIGSDRYDVFVLIPNENVNILIDAKEDGLMMGTTATGPHAANFNYFGYYLKKNREKYPSETYAARTAKLDVLEYIKLQEEVSRYDLKMLGEYMKSFKLTNDYYHWLKATYKYSPYNNAIEWVRGKRQITDPTAFKLITAQLGNDDYAAKNCIEYNYLLAYYMHYEFNGLSYPIDGIKFIAFVNETDFNEVTRSVALTRIMVSFATLRNDSSYNAIFNQFNACVKDKELLKLVIDSRNAQLGQMSNRIKENISQASSLNQILNKYKGKLIYLDFWGSWCAPCRAEMPNAARLREKLKGRDIVFVYFGYKDVQDKWLAAQQELKIEGEHYLLTPDQISEANDLFEIRGVPRYVIIGKDGTLINKNANRPGKVYEELDKLAAK
ncbi:TlpA family protein disulfide reductase [Pedobacter sp. HDW13]|uniref:TlpA family protein disulfide reductase n=1 Tax=Pedobacter sp. HDW13 TaxID=2714940 RepID=UPI001407FB08|nr:TlpA disulfide reductase family protein [Pedobacter sp. HDW13]QIL38567.1 TlpA family protein disulfide reductase [Pedobacter sp. HDW13]